MRKGLAIAEIMALLLLVLPTMAFIMMLLIEYWAVMRIDNNMKLMTNIVSSKLDGLEDLSSTSSIDGTDGISELKTLLATYCPQGSVPSFTRTEGPANGQIDVIAQYTYDGNYIKNKQLSSSMATYSYHDQNATIIIVCPAN